MNADFYLCDACKKSTKMRTFVATAGRAMDAAGSMDTVGENVDLCHECYVELLIELCRNDHEMGKRVLSVINGIKRRKRR